MKIPQLLSAFSVAVTLMIQVNASADPSKNTAVHIKAHSPTLADKEVSLDVSYVKPLNKIESEKYAFVIARTWDDKENVYGGDVLVVIAKDDLTKTLDRFGVAPDIEQKGRVNRDVDTHKLTGILKLTAEKRTFIDATGGQVKAEELPKGLQDEMKDAPASGKKQDSPKKPGNKGKKPAKGKK